VVAFQVFKHLFLDENTSFSGKRGRLNFGVFSPTQTQVFISGTVISQLVRIKIFHSFEVCKVWWKLMIVDFLLLVIIIIQKAIEHIRSSISCKTMVFFEAPLDAKSWRFCGVMCKSRTCQIFLKIIRYVLHLGWSQNNICDTIAKAMVNVNEFVLVYSWINISSPFGSCCERQSCLQCLSRRVPESGKNSVRNLEHDGVEIFVSGVCCIL